MNTDVLNTRPISPRQDGPELGATRSKRTMVSSPTRSVSPREVPLPLSPIPDSPYTRMLSQSSSFVSTQHSQARGSVETPAPICTGTQRSPPARPPRPPTSLPNIRPTIILSPFLAQFLPPGDRPLFLNGKRSSSTTSSSPSKAAFSISTSSTCEEPRHPTYTPPSPCFFKSSATYQSCLTPDSDHGPSPAQGGHRLSSLPIPHRSPRKTQRQRSSHGHLELETYSRGHSSSSVSTVAHRSTNTSLWALMTASAASSPSSSLMRLPPPQPPSPSPYPPPTSPLPAPPTQPTPPSPQVPFNSRSKTHSRVHYSAPTDAAAQHYDPPTDDHHHDEIPTPREKIDISANYTPFPKYHPLREVYSQTSRLHYNLHQEEYYRPHDQTKSSLCYLPEINEEDEPPIEPRSPRWKTRRRKYLWMLATAAMVALLVGGILGGVLWRLSRA